MVLPPDDLPPTRRSPTGRVPRWAVDEAAGRPAVPPPWRAAPTGARRRSGARRLLSIGAVVALVAGFVVVERSGALGDITSTAGPGSGFAARVPAGQQEQPQPLGTPEAVAVPDERWRALETHDGEPVRWDPCRPVHYVVNPAGMPAGGREVLDDALTRVSRASGLQFVDDGTTDETDRSAPVVAARYGQRWAPVLVRWDLPAQQVGSQDGQAPGEVLGRGGPVSVASPTGVRVNTSGTVGLTTTASTTLDPATPWGRLEMRAVWMHEWAHVVGLAHVDDPSQLMNSSTSGLVEFAAGDLTGLAVLGSGPCVPNV